MCGLRDLNEAKHTFFIAWNPKYPPPTPFTPLPILPSVWAWFLSPVPLTLAYELKQIKVTVMQP